MIDPLIWDHICNFNHHAFEEILNFQFPKTSSYSWVCPIVENLWFRLKWPMAAFNIIHDTGVVANYTSHFKFKTLIFCYSFYSQKTSAGVSTLFFPRGPKFQQQSLTRPPIWKMLHVTLTVVASVKNFNFWRKGWGKRVWSKCVYSAQ